jgi:GntR family transcriptional regulator
MTNKGQAVRGRIGTGEPRLTPLYHQIYIVLRRKILDSELESDQPLPGENQLAQEFGVSRVTIRKALHNLEQDGFIIKRCGIGSFPVPQAVEFRDRYNIGGPDEALTGPDDSTKLTTLSIEMIKAPAHIREKLATSTDKTSEHGEQQVLRLNRRRSSRGEPFTIMTAWFSALHAADLDHQTLKNMPPPAALLAIGISLERAEQWISARNADETTASLLNVPVGTALIFMGTVFHDQQDQAVLMLESLYRPDLYEYRSTMRLSRSGQWQE